ncbi:hypothetical protein DV711_02975 [Motiliproteus coralliicola]|uniref:Uncharacterized protein n=1 Tax=Motiliproteus coralliicola TaxID=2283196 RepID=A0A369WR38_9GAMM|nr:hypothetical protein [Motiliproteus coralliicola]RDE24568.1 hypothetical protein DV711_02975 [Motiliproteus coralliicola]
MSKQQPPSHDNDLDDDLDALSSLYARTHTESADGDPEQASAIDSAIDPATDNAILAAARRELGSAPHLQSAQTSDPRGPKQPTPTPKTAPRRRWRSSVTVPLAGAAVVVLSTTLYFDNQQQLTQPQPQLEAPSPALQAPVEVQSGSLSQPRAKSEPQTRTEFDAAAELGTAADPAESMQAPATMADPIRAEQRQDTSPTAAPLMQQVKPHAELIEQQSRQRQQTFKRQADTLAPAAPMAERKAIAPGSTSALQAEPELSDAAESLAPEAWLLRIQQLLQQGDQAGALAQLKQWRQRYPQQPLPDWAQALLNSGSTP